MATMAASPPSGASGNGEATPKLPMPSRNPIPLSASQEAQVREVFYARVRRLCQPEIKAFADCAMGRTFSVPFACRETHRLMNGCMKAHATEAEHDAAREEWFAGRLERQRERERKARRKLEQERFHREWWGLPERDRDEVRREEEKLARAERVGGYAAPGRPRVGGGGGGGDGSGASSTEPRKGSGSER
ncbi:hypothetical protein MAPG_07020 [Magnaporthiopsis poae ATCC 64411]|uniref:COX assembly mitochondrial protein n=1 Tax=Magnaporthiopsis poae (strain ATCC 64411 / 73-15) TaxID=644358 RepID=A0A0C4E3L4_MAGP6|nr:hypothetical protein MAPG_07020 [Magnaporthiopsis poae ATCC 64411]